MQRTSIASFAIASSVLLAVNLPAQAASQAPQARVDATQQSRAKLLQLVDAHHRAGLFEGVVLVGEGDRILLHEARGLADRTWQRAHTLDTRLHIGSVGKQLTATVVLQLMEEGKLRLDDTVSKLLPDYPRAQGDKVTVRMLLNHTSGIPTYTSMPEWRTRASNRTSREDVVALFSKKPFAFEPGTSWAYNNSGFFLLGVILEKLEGKHFGQILQERIFEPLGLKDMGYMFVDRVIPKYAEGYNWAGAGYAPELYCHPSWVLSNAMVYADADDLFRWTRALHAGKPFRRDSTRRLMLEAPEGQERAYTCGIGIVPLDIGGRRYTGIGHSGALGGFQSHVSYLPEREWTIVILCNIGVDTAALRDQITAVLAGQSVTPPKPPVSRAISSKIDELGLDEARNWFRARMGDNPRRYEIDEGGMNLLGYAFLARRDMERALLVLELNNEAHPGSANTFDSLGEAHLANGDEKRALELYRKAIAMDPSNTNAKAIVSRLAAKVEEEKTKKK